MSRYVHVEVHELRGLKGGLTVEADVALTLPNGTRTHAVAELRTTHAPYWRVIAIEDFGNPLVALVFDLIGEEALFSRIATAAALWNVWDSIQSLQPSQE